MPSLRTLRLAFLGLTCLLAAAAPVGARQNPNANRDQIFVPGYHRSDGTWVRGHWRTRANATEEDNLSYRGDHPDRMLSGSGTLTNPADLASTKVEGWGVTKRAALEAKTWEEREDRRAVAVRLGRMGVAVDWRYPTEAALLRVEWWTRRSRELSERLGEPVSPRPHEMHEVQDLSCRAEMADLLEREGDRVDWEEHSLAELSGRLARAKAKRGQ